MAFADSLRDQVDDLFGRSFTVREGQVIPESADVALKDGAVKVDATFLYADLAGSSVLAQACPWSTTAKIIRAYLECAVRLIRVWGGEIRSFDGDRVMGVFMGDSKNTSAAQCAREIDWTVTSIINPKAKANFDSISNNGINIRHAVGLDTGVARAVRGGIRNNNDLIWIGTAPSFAAKLSDVRAYPYEVYISSRVYAALAAHAKIVDGSDIWSPEVFTFAGKSEWVYRTAKIKEP